MHVTHWAWNFLAVCPVKKGEEAELDSRPARRWPPARPELRRPIAKSAVTYSCARWRGRRVRRLNVAVEAVFRYRRRRPEPWCWEAVVTAACDREANRDVDAAMTQAGRAVAAHADRIAESLDKRLRLIVRASGHSIEVHALALAGMGDVRALPALRRLAKDSRLPSDRPGDPTLALDVCGSAVASGSGSHGLPFLADLGPLAAAHTDTVRGLMESPGAWTRVAAAHAYRRITGDSDPAVPVLPAAVDPAWTGQPAMPVQEAVRTGAGAARACCQARTAAEVARAAARGGRAPLTRVVRCGCGSGSPAAPPPGADPRARGGAAAGAGASRTRPARRGNRRPGRAGRPPRRARSGWRWPR